MAAFDGTFAGWRAVARVALLEGRAPDRAQWQAESSDQSALPLAFDDAAPVAAGTLDVPRRFLVLGDAVSYHRSESRWALLYRVLWRLTHGEPRLLDVESDPDVHALLLLERAVRRASHKMKAFVRFREVAHDDGLRFVAWFEPTQPVVARVAPFFVRRFPSMRWSILTPDGSAHWDLETLQFGAGVPRHEAPAEDALEDLWRAYYANIFNPARLNLEAMRAEMAARYWKDLPEARLIPELAREAPARVARMIARAAAAPEPIPDDLASRVPVGDVPTRTAVVATRSDVDEGPGWDATYDPGTRAAAARDALVRRHAPTGITLAGGGRVLVGTASWTDPTLLACGRFYPAGVDTPEARLRHYASRFPMVEVDATYYAMPTRAMAAAWAARTPDRFVFDVKAHALMTGHPTARNRLPDWLRRELRGGADDPRVRAADLPDALHDEVWRRFLDALAPLRDAGKLGAVLLQYPRWFEPTRESADTLRRAAERLGGTLGAVELRNPAWMEGRLAARTLALLEELGLAWVMVDAPAGTRSSMPPVVAVTTPKLAVVRLHGRRADAWEARHDVVSERYRYLYERPQLARWVTDIVDVAKQVQGVHVVHNNCHANYGTTNAAEITELLVEFDEERTKSASGSQLPAASPA